MITTLDKVCSLLPKASPGVAELERPEKVVGCLEIWSHCVDLVDNVLDTDESILPQNSLDDGVIRESSSLVIVYFTVASFVDKLSNRLKIGVAGEKRSKMRY